MSGVVMATIGRCLPLLRAGAKNTGTLMIPLARLVGLAASLSAAHRTRARRDVANRVAGAGHSRPGGGSRPAADEITRAGCRIGRVKWAGGRATWQWVPASDSAPRLP